MTNAVLTITNADKIIGGLKVRKAVQQFRGTFLSLYGQGGAGKTVLAASLYVLGKLLHVDAEGGTDSVTQWEEEENLDIVDVKNWGEFERLVESLVKDTKDYVTIVIDNLCEIIDLCEDKWGIKGNDSHDLQKYNLVKKDVLHAVKQLRDITRTRNVNVVICCWDADEKDDRGVIKKDLAFTPALRKEYPGICTIIGHVNVLRDPDMRMLDFKPNPKTVSKIKRATNSSAMKVPYEIYYTVENLPLADVLRTIRGEQDWPATRYKKPSNSDDN